MKGFELRAFVCGPQEVVKQESNDGHTPPRVFFVRVANKGLILDARQFRVSSQQET